MTKLRSKSVRTNDHPTDYCSWYILASLLARVGVIREKSWNLVEGDQKGLKKGLIMGRKGKVVRASVFYSIPPINHDIVFIRRRRFRAITGHVPDFEIVCLTVVG